MKQKKIFVTGGNGFIGSRVVEQLSELDYEVRCLLRETSNTRRIDKFPVERAKGDIRDFDSLLEGMKGCDGVIHLAGISNWNDIHASSLQEIVARGSENVFRAAQQSGNIRCVYVSTTVAVNASKEPVLFNEDSPFELTSRQYSYSIAKNEAEKTAKRYSEEGVPIVTVCPGEVYGEFDYDLITAGNLIDFAKSKPVFVCRGGTSVAYVDDVAQGIIAAFEKGKSGERYILGGDNLTIKELAEFTLKILELEKKIVNLPNSLISGLAKVCRVLHIPLPFNPAVVPYAIKYWFMDNSKAKNELGVSFRDAEAALRPTLKWLKEDGYI